MKPIRMLRTQDGSPDGLTVLVYVQGQEYPAAGCPLSAFLRDVFLREGWAEECAPADPALTSSQEPAASAIVQPTPEPPRTAPGGVKRLTDHVPRESAPSGNSRQCPTVSPVGEECGLLDGHAPDHEWKPKPTARTKRSRRGT